MRKLREIRIQKGYSLGQLSSISGVPKSTINQYEVGKVKKINDKSLNKLANALNCTPQELSATIGEPVVKTFKCLNENCLLNKNKNCDNPIVLSGKAPCFGKNKVQAKEKILYGNTKILFANRKI